MVSREQVEEVIFEAIDEINRTLDLPGGVERSRETVLVGESSRLDSLAFVNFAAVVEEGLARAFRQPLSVFDLISANERERWTVADLAEGILDALQ